MFSCEYNCGRKFDMREKLFQHMQRRHGVQPPLQPPRLPSLNKRITVPEKTTEPSPARALVTAPAPRKPLLKSLSRSNNIPKPQPQPTSESVLRIADTLTKTFRPTTSSLQYLSIRRCGLQELQLSSLLFLREIDVSENQLNNICFLDFPQNLLLKKATLDNNLISQLVAKTALLQISLFNNRVKSIAAVRSFLFSNPQLERLNLELNYVRKAINYQQELILAGPNLKHLDEKRIKDTDTEVALQYSKIFSRRPQTAGASCRQNYSQRFRNKVEKIKEQSVEHQLKKNPRDLNASILQSKSQCKLLHKKIREIEEENRLLKQRLQSIEDQSLLDRHEENEGLAEEVAELKRAIQFLEMCRLVQEQEDIPLILNFA